MKTDETSTSEDYIVRIKEVAQMTGLAKSTLYSINSHDETFPKKVPLGTNAVGWYKSEITDWLNSKRHTIQSSINQPNLQGFSIQQNKTTTEDDCVIRIKEVASLTGLSRSTLYSINSYDETFPKKVPLGNNSVGWFKSEITDWLNSRKRH